jgi:hypothetical protein
VLVFRRRSTTAPDVLDQDPAPAASADPADPDGPGAVRGGQTAGKGRPTPKRSEAERRRRQPYRAPTDRKAAVQQTRERDKANRARKFAAAKRGEDWALPRKDQGPVRGLARDFVDSRRRISEYYMYAVGVLVILLFIPKLRLYADYVVLVIIVMMVSEGLLVGRQVIKLAQQRFPGESTRGIRWYAAIRCTQIRKLRMPAPRVKPGDSF